LDFSQAILDVFEEGELEVGAFDDVSSDVAICGHDHGESSQLVDVLDVLLRPVQFLDEVVEGGCTANVNAWVLWLEPFQSLPFLD
jgi:hypothetical protein